MKKICFGLIFCFGLALQASCQIVEILNIKDSIQFAPNKTVNSSILIKSSGFANTASILVKITQGSMTTLSPEFIKSEFDREIVLKGNSAETIFVEFEFKEEEVKGSYFFEVSYSIDAGKTFTKIYFKNPLEIKILERKNIAMGGLSRVFIGGSFDFFEKLSIKDLAGSIEIYAPQALSKKDGINFKVYSTRTFSKENELNSAFTANSQPDFSTLNSQNDSIVVKTYNIQYTESYVIDNWGLRLAYMREIFEEGDYNQGVYLSLGGSIELINRSISYSRKFDTLGVFNNKVLLTDSLKFRYIPEKNLSKQFEYYIGVDLGLRYYILKSFDFRLLWTPGIVRNNYMERKLGLFNNIGFDLQEKATGLNVTLGGEIRVQAGQLSRSQTNKGLNFYTLYLGTSFSFEKLKGLFQTQN